jgi:hypothetical protein
MLIGGQIELENLPIRLFLYLDRIKALLPDLPKIEKK